MIRDILSLCNTTIYYFISEVEESLKRLVGHKGVIGTIVVNNEGVPIKSTMPPQSSTVDC